MNNARNEMLIKLAGEEILLRPDFENIEAMESNIGGVSYLGWKFSRSAHQGGPGKASIDEIAKCLPSMTDCAKIIYYNQAARKIEDPTLRKFSLEEIFEKVVNEGSASVVSMVTRYVTRLLAGDKLNVIEDMSLEEKKSSLTESKNQAQKM